MLLPSFLTEILCHGKSALDILEIHYKATIVYTCKKGKLISKINALLQECNYVDPVLLTKILCIHVTAFYGSSLWDIYSVEVIKIFSSWNVTVRNVFKLPRTTHRYFIEPVSYSSKDYVVHPPGEALGDPLDLFQGERPLLSKHKKNDRRALLGSTISTIWI